MPSPSPEIIQLLSVFSIAFTAPTFQKALVLIFGTILAPGRRTVTAALRMMGLGADPHYSKYHRVLNRDRWSPWVVSRILLSLIILFFVPPGVPLLLVIDETLERRRGQKIKYKGWFRDPIRSSATHVVTTLGLRWVCLAVLVPVPWSKRVWLLPFMTILAPGEKTSAKLNKRHRTLVQWAEYMIDKVHRWQPDREMMLVGDGSYAAIVLVQRCQRLKSPSNWSLVCVWMPACLISQSHNRRANAAPNPRKGSARPSLPNAWQTQKPNGRNSNSCSMARNSSSNSSPVWLSGTPQDKIRLPCVGCWCVVQKKALNLLPTSVPIRRYRPSKSSCGLPGAGISKSPSKNCGPASVSKPNASGLTGPSNAPRPVYLASSAW